MAKVTIPLFSISATGKLGAISFSVRNNVKRIKYQRHHTFTQKQKEQQKKFGMRMKMFYKFWHKRDLPAKAPIFREVI